MNNETRFTIVIYEPNKKDFSNLKVLINEAITEALRIEGVRKHVIETYLTKAGGISLVRWSQLEQLGKLGGDLTSAPTVSSRRPNHLDVFARGTGNALFKRTWNGTRWEYWERIGGNLTSAPAAVSWGPNRTDVFARGQNQSLIHLWQGR